MDPIVLLRTFSAEHEVRIRDALLQRVVRSSRAQSRNRLAPWPAPPARRG